MKSAVTFLLAIGATFLIVWLLAAIALKLTGVPRGWPPFTTLPLLSGVIGGYVGALVVYTILRASTRDPMRTFLFVSILCLAVSFALPLRLSFTKSKRFQGVTPAAQMTLALLHTTIATAVVAFFTRSA